MERVCKLENAKFRKKIVKNFPEKSNIMRGINYTKKYCDKCWKEKERELWRENKRKHRYVQV